jgi:lipopolysaccharide export system permease protein
MCIGRFVSEREILAMNALGVSVRFIIVPVLCVGVLISIGSFLANDILLPAGTIQFSKLYRKILTSTPALELESNSVKRNQNAIVVAGTIRGNDIASVVVVDVDSDGNNRIIAAPGATIQKSSSPAVVMTLALADPKILVINRKKAGTYDSIISKNMSYNILAKSVLSAYSNAISPHEMSSRDLYAELKKKDFGKDTRTKNMYLMEFQKKFSIPFGAFFFVILAFPLGLLSRTNGQNVGFILGLIISVLYWAMLIGGQMLSLQLGILGSLMMWLPNIIVFGVGFVLILGRLSR